MSSKKRFVEFLTYKPSGEVECSYNDAEIEFLNHDDKKYILLNKDSLKGSFYRVDLATYQSLINIINNKKNLSNSKCFEKIKNMLVGYWL